VIAIVIVIVIVTVIVAVHGATWRKAVQPSE